MRFDLVPLALLTAALSAAMLAAAFAFQHLGRLDPCVLCIYQRWPWAAAAGLGLLAAVFARYRTAAKAALALAVAALLTGAGIAAYHVGVEQHWWAGTSECGGVTGQAKTIEELKAQLLATPVTRCDEVAWSLFGISMAGWNLIVSAMAAVLLAWQLMMSKRSPQ